MYKLMVLITAVVLASALDVSAQNSGAVQPDSAVEAQVDFSHTANTVDFAQVRRCCVASGSIRVRTRDQFIAGDIWRAVVHEGGVSDVTSNTNGKGVNAPALPPGIFGNIASIPRRCAWVVTTLGNSAPGGLPAGGQTQVTSSAGSAVFCTVESTHP
jgi:hypothetical protein